MKALRIESTLIPVCIGLAAQAVEDPYRIPVIIDARAIKADFWQVLVTNLSIH